MMSDAVGNQMLVLIVGGSVSGLMCGIALKHAGHNVYIIERDSDQRDSHMAGVGLGPDVKHFLSLHDRLDSPFSLDATCTRVLYPSTGNVMEVPALRALTSWDTLYYRLRNIFDGYLSDHSPLPASTKPSDGTGEFHSRQQLVDVRSNAGSQQIIASIKDHREGKTYEQAFDYIISAEGSNSIIRQKYLPSSQQRYAGYVGLRGTVPESELTLETRKVFESNITMLIMGRHHCLVYMIPGPNGSLQPGTRLVNFLWYHNASLSRLDEIMIDSITGMRHRNTVPAGHVRAEVWNSYLDIARTVPFTPPFLELINKIRRPFIQVISTFHSPRAAFENGRVLLVGNAVSLFRPHTASSSIQAAFHALETARLLKGEINVQRWEERVLRFARLHWAQAEFWGSYTQHHWSVAVVALLRYWWFGALDWVAAWWYGEEKLLRNISAARKVKNKDD